MALVSQDVTLFDDTVRANIALGRMDADEDAIIEAAKAADAHDFIKAWTAAMTCAGRAQRRQSVRRAAPAYRHRPCGS
jgi:ABC-type protease/lipase transport system fused ATPase/permease subunit